MPHGHQPVVMSVTLSAVEVLARKSARDLLDAKALTKKDLCILSTWVLIGGVPPVEHLEPHIEDQVDEERENQPAVMPEVASFLPWYHHPLVKEAHPGVLVCDSSL